MDRPTILYVLIIFGIVILSALRAWLEKRGRLTRFFESLGRCEVGALALLVGGLVFFGCLQILLRNVFHRGIFWAEPLMRHIVLWLGCLGGAYATSRIRHINIDIFSRFLSGRPRILRDSAIHFATAAAAIFLGFAALKLILDEKAYGEKAFLGIDTWVLQSVLPFAFFLIAYRSLLNILLKRKDTAFKRHENS
ncbi:MAG: TRAP transporter small permease subunit [Candidatus Latescibacteria bacterium]|nr:TRAP transporter small permease subunit [Candidatus Latescibacterota bacterium]NIM64507.1 TRAP transporter small permease subunit [Candidatus Latescibacterota bacterium]NIO00660.1 TRAP transporter small permease subunit [Candidatus Latescibacterota bacterium]NIO27063.1 TRAP transporter small permease subunit [Candidatus Latescibacterota bacterium]NIO54587.1 TRAP transporter small permease subunit [Candidatus Latescibacterota bacterium]